MYIYAPLASIALFKGGYPVGRELEIVKVVEYDRHNDHDYDLVQVKTTDKHGPERKFRCLRGDLMPIDD